MQKLDSLVKIEVSPSTILPSGKKILFLAGAGVSMDPPTSLPSARSIVRTLTDFCVLPEDAEPLLSAKTLRYEQLVEGIQRTMDDELKFLNYFDLVDEPNEIHLFLASAIVKGHDVVTTNFDYSIEQALQQILPPDHHPDIMPIITMTDYEQLKDSTPIRAQAKFPLYKIHGSKKNIIKHLNTESSLITTISSLSQYKAPEEVFGLESFKQPVVEALAKDRVLVVMGYSGSDDFDISPFLKKMQGISRIVWIDHVVDPNTTMLAFRVEATNAGGRTQEISHVDSLLFDIKLNGPNPDMEILKVVANTGKFIKEIAWDVLKSSGTPIPQLKPREPSKVSRPLFKDWCKPFFANIRELDKFVLAHLLFQQLQLGDAKARCIDAGLASAIRQGNKQFIFTFTNYKATTALADARLQEARTLFERALAIAREENNPIGLAAVFMNLGMVWHAEGNIDKAMELYNAALAATDEVSTLIKARLNGAATDKIKALNDLSPQNQRFIMNLSGFDTNLRFLSNRNLLLNNIGSLYLTRGDLGRALQSFKDALVVDEQLGDTYGKAKSLMNLGRIFARNKMYSEAIAKFSEALNVAENLADRDAIATVYGELGNLYYNMGDYYLAIDYYDQALAKQEECGNKVAVATIWNSLSNVYRDSYKKNLVHVCLAKALSIRKALNNPVGIASVLLNTSKVHLLWGDYTDALASALEALGVNSSVGSKDGIIESKRLMGYIYQRMENYPEAIKCYQEVIATAKEMNNTSLQTEYQASVAKAERLMTNSKGTSPPTKESCLASFNQGMRAASMGDRLSAFVEFKNGLQAALTLQELPIAANLFNLLAQVSEQMTRYDDAIDYAMEATVLYDKLQNFHDMATLVEFSAEVYAKKQELLRAASYHLRAFEIHEMLGSTLENLDLLRKVFQIYADLGQPERAVPHLEKMYDIAKTGNNLEKLGDAISWLAFVALSSGDYSGAENWFKEGLIVDETQGNFEGYYSGLLSIGTCYEMRGDLAPAFDWYSRARVYAQSHKLDPIDSEDLMQKVEQSLKIVETQPTANALSLDTLLDGGIKQAQQQHPDQAIISFLAGLSLAANQQPALVPQFLYQIGVYSQPNTVLALNYLEEASRQARKVRNLEIQAACARLSGQIHVKDQQWARAGFQFGIAARLYERLQNYADQAQTLVSLAKVQDSETNFARAFYFEAAGDSYNRAKNIDAAVQSYLDAAKVFKEIALPQKMATCLAKAGHSSLSAGKTGDASKYFADALSIDPANGEALYDQARICARNNVPAPALDKLRQAIAVDIKHSYAARKEPDFSGLKDLPDFITLVKN